MDKVLHHLDALIRSIVSSPYFGVAGLVIGLISLLYALRVARRDRKEKGLSCSLTSTNLIKNQKAVYPKLQIIYEGKSLDNFTVTNVRISNSGTEVLSMEDVARNSPLRIGMQPDRSIELLDYNVIYVSDPNNNFRINRIDERTIQMEFDYVEPKDKATIQLLHTGEAEKDIKITGTIIGAKKPFEPKSLTDDTDLASFKRFMFKWSRIIAILFFISIAILFCYLAYLFSGQLIISIILLIPAAYFIWLSLRIGVSRPDPDRNAFAHEVVSTMFDRLASDFRQRQQLDKKEKE